MKKTQLLPVYILLSATLTISSANPPMRYVFTDKMDFSLPNFPANHFDDNIFSDPQFNPYLLRNYNYFESQKIPTLETTQEYMGGYVNPQIVNDSPYGWQIYNVNGQQEPQMPLIKQPQFFPTRGFPITGVYFDMVKGTTKEIPTENSINVDEISFGPSASHIATAPKKIQIEQLYATSPIPYKNVETQQENIYKTVNEVEPKDISEITTHKIKAIENVVTTTPKAEQVSTKTIPPVPTLSPWLDGFGK